MTDFERGFAAGVEKAAQVRCVECRRGVPLLPSGIRHREVSGFEKWCDARDIRALAPTPDRASIISSAEALGAAPPDSPEAKPIAKLVDDALKRSEPLVKEAKAIGRSISGADSNMRIASPAPSGKAVCATCGHPAHDSNGGMCLVPMSDYVCACTVPGRPR